MNIDEIFSVFILYCDLTVNQTWTSDFQPFSSHGTCKLTTKIMWLIKQYIFVADLTKISIILNHLHGMAIVLAVVIFFSI